LADPGAVGEDALGVPFDLRDQPPLALGRIFVPAHQDGRLAAPGQGLVTQSLEEAC